MAKCDRCGSTFNVSDARSEYNAEFESKGLTTYDDEYGGEVCAKCAIAETETNMNQGRAIAMMNGDEEYDDDFVQEWL